MATQKKKGTQVVKKATANKPAVKKSVSAVKKVITSKKSPEKKHLAKKTVTAKKQSPKPKTATKKVVKPINKSSLAKKPAKSAVKKAVPKKLPNKKIVAKKAAALPKKAKVAVPLKTQVKANKTKTGLQKPVEKAVAKAPVVNINDHKKELKKALKNAVKNNESKKPEKPFVMPKTNTEKSRKYEPQFVKSVLDHAPEENNGPSMRYSDAELNEFRELISRKLETAKKELGYLQGLITRKDEMGGDDTDNRYMTMEDGSLSMEREQLSQMASRQITFIDHLEKAMMRIENKTYGICRVTGKLIDKARLRAVPHATLSIEAKMGIAK
ncbi:TraR/DksA family transcriptional regulator [Ginsengibacter hankyongi]|uniref:TraR/DksA family transcriptional regulator n=1 Tax=Ginsengibacter hankyongi TaxID=2607284 RepID=A0A5J5IGW4_9BACT|nr:TraR/DksA C4-type zinc finger protein [Ginsengibacter hankyongi]KAA9039354.1 TraR/DksA family transcriptional regulator [Ginsengibacter hankyongi]